MSKRGDEPATMPMEHRRSGLWKYSHRGGKMMSKGRVEAGAQIGAVSVAIKRARARADEVEKATIK